MKKSDLLSGDSPNWYLDLPSPRFGDYFGSVSSLTRGETYLTYDRKYIVHRGEDGRISVRRNACAHAGAPLLTEPGVQDLKEIRCPIHKWTYAPSGELLAAPYFNECKHIRLARPVYGTWNGYVLGFSEDELESKLGSFGASLGLPKSAFAPNEFIFLGEELIDLPYPRQLMLINYFDGYHVPLYHQKTFDAVTDCNSYEWEIPDDDPHDRVSYSIQLVRSRPDVKRQLERLKRAYKESREAFGWADFHLWLEQVLPGVPTPIPSDIFAVWATIYGNGYLMPELYEGGRFMAVSYLVSKNGADSDTQNLNLVEYYMHRSVYDALSASDRRLAERKFKYAYDQSAREDDAICAKLWEGHRQGPLSYSRIYHELLEAGDLHWRKWYLQHSS